MRRTSRATQAILVSCVLGAGAPVALAQEEPPAAASSKPRSREAEVLKVLHGELDGRTATWFWRSRLVREQVGPTTRVLATIPITCGNSLGGFVPSARLADLEKQLIIAFTGRPGPSTLAIVERDYPVMDGDTFTPLAAFAVDVVGHLDDRLEHEDEQDRERVDLTLLTSTSMNAWPLPPARNSKGGTESSVIGGGVSEFADETKLVFDCRPDARGSGWGARQLPVVVKEGVRTTAGQVVLLGLPFHPTTDPAGQGIPTMVARVFRPGTTEPVAVATSPMIWLPSSLDVAQPFRVEVVFGPGVWTWGHHVLATAPDP
jgi:hypothetical protein